MGTIAQQHANYLARKAKRPAPAPDPILSLSPEHRAYIAGLTDGEGCLRIGAVGPNRSYFYPIFCLAMTNRPVIEWLTERLRGGTIKLQNYTRVNENKGWKPQYSIFLSGKRVKLLCESLEPYLIVEKAQAALIRFFEAMRLLNLRGLRKEIAVGN